MTVEDMTLERRTTGRTWTLWTLRIVTTVHAAAVVTLPILMGAYLNGTFGALAVHGLIGSLLAALAIVLMTATALYVVIGRGRYWLLALSIVIFLGEGLQIGMGYAREMQVHVPLGVLIVGVGVALCVWTWTPGARQYRRRPR